ncbi:MAG: M56 family metallopeptidase [Eubacteriales bacterium]|nr:M56 family metallopeptidase [Eubacteriales bacterium]
MSAAGTAPILVCVILWVIMRRKFSYHLGKRLLFTSMFFYLAPIQLIKYLLPQTIFDGMDFNAITRVFENYQNSISIHLGKQLVWTPNWLVYILTVWLFLILIFSMYQIIKYNYRVYILRRYSHKRLVDIPGVGKREIRVIDSISSPYTVGFVRRFIIFPEDLLEDSCSGMILRHEYAHLENYDSLMKLVCLIIICIYWMNPFAVILLILYSIFCEFIADEAAIERHTKEEKKAYIKIMIETASKSAEIPVVWKNDFFSGKNILKRRMDYIMRKNILSKLAKGLSACAMAVAIMTSCSTIFAYTPLQSSSGSGNDSIMSDGQFLEFVVNENDQIVDFDRSDYIFITDDGVKTYINENQTSPNASFICIHNFVSGTLQKHVSNNSGGCTMYVYDAKQCQKCGHLVINDLINTITYAKCIHGY